MESNKKKSVNIEEELHKELKKEAIDKGLTLQEYLEEIIKQRK